MRVLCIHCGQAFSVVARQLGREGRCPHCHGTIRLPEATEETEHPAELPARFHWLKNSMSGLLSLVFHLAVILILALISYDASRGGGGSADVLIGTLPSVDLGESQEKELEAAEVVVNTTSDTVESLAVEPPAETGAAASDQAELAVAAPSASGDTGAFEFGNVAVGGGAMSGGSWDGMLQSLRRHGLDIVVAFDSTGSMQGEINQVKRQIGRIGSTLLTLVPKTRISICTYRDQGDEYVVRGIPLTDDLQAVENYLAGITANGGADEPEAVHDGIRWSISENDFRPGARKVILLFGDAPPHPEHLPTCLRLASDFNGQRRGVVSTVTCRAAEPLPSFIDIAEVGGGEAFVTANERQIMTQLIVLVFGSRHRAKVLEAFKLLERKQ